MGDDNEQTGKRRKSLEGREDLAAPGAPAAAAVQPRRRDSIEAMCSASFIEKEANRTRSNRVSIDNCAPGQTKRLSQDLSRDVEKINEQLSQLLFSDGGAPEDPKGGSMDTRRTREPQSYYNRTRRVPASSGLDASAVMPWQNAPNSDASSSLPWMQAGPTASREGGSDAALPWGSGSDMPPSRSSLDAVVERSGRRSMQGRRSSLSRAPLPAGISETGAEGDSMDIGEGFGQVGNAPPSVEALTAPSGSTTSFQRKFIRSTKNREKMQQG